MTIPVIRVRHLIKGLGRGGAEMLLAEGYPFRTDSRFDYGYGYFLPWKDAMVPSLRDQGASVECLRATNSVACLAAARRVAAWLESEQADLLHCHLPVASIVGRLAGRMAGVPVVSTEHNVLEGYHPITRAATKATWRLQRYVVSVSAEVESSIARAVGDDVPVKTIRNGVATHRFAPVAGAREALRDRLNISATAPVIGTVAVFRQHKRLDIWAEAARSILEEFPDAHFVLVGDGPLKADVGRWVREAGLSGHVTLPGLLKDVRPWVSGFDVYMMSSDFEGLPVALLEAMSSEIPGVVTDVGGIREALRDGREGFITVRGRPDLLAGRVCDLLRSPALRETMGRSARRRAVEEFGMARMVGSLEEVYDEVLAGS